MPGPLHGVKIIEMTSVVLGPWACQMLADMGADVILVDTIGKSPRDAVRLAEMQRLVAGINEAVCEGLAFASLLAGGTSIRLSGQDSRRGTFSPSRRQMRSTRLRFTCHPASRSNAVTRR